MKGTSSLTLRQGDVTIFMDVEDFTITHDDGYSDDIWERGFYDRSLETTFAIKATMVPDENSHYYTVHKAGKPVVRTARIELDHVSETILAQAKTRLGVPVDADTAMEHEGGVWTCKFTWKETIYD